MTHDDIDGLTDRQLPVDYFYSASWHHSGFQVQHFLHNFYPQNSLSTTVNVSSMPEYGLDTFSE